MSDTAQRLHIFSVTIDAASADQLSQRGQLRPGSDHPLAVSTQVGQFTGLITLSVRL